jgi:hypothetical protein
MAALLGLVFVKPTVGLVVFRARENLWTTLCTTPDPGKPPKTALRAGLDNRGLSDWATTVPTSRFAMFVAADWLRHRLPVFAGCSRQLIRHLCKPLLARGLD